MLPDVDTDDRYMTEQRVLISSSDNFQSFSLGIQCLRGNEGSSLEETRLFSGMK